MSEIPKAYEPGPVEKERYKFWMESGYFTPKIDHKKKPFVIIMPPPNVTGELHLGHALTATLEDIMTRWHRMKGDPTLWLPGVDHAGIAAQVVVEKAAGQRRPDRHQLGREKFEERCMAVGATSPAAPSPSSTNGWAPPATGPANASPWTKGPVGRCAPPSSASMTKA